MHLQDMYDELIKRIRLPDNSNKYHELFNSCRSKDKNDNLIYWEINKKIPELLERIPKCDGEEKELFIKDYIVSINKVKQLLDIKGWVKLEKEFGVQEDI